jgi:hypothetical protein
VDEESWTELFTFFLEAGVLLPPGREEPLILPGVLSAGEEAKLAALFAGPPAIAEIPAITELPPGDTARA